MDEFEKIGEIRKRRNSKTEGLRQRILEESIKLFVEQGYDKTTTRQIIQKVGILNGSLYNIYRSKEDIFADIILLSLAQVMENIPSDIKEGMRPLDHLIYFMCVEIHLSAHSQRIAELLCIVNDNWTIRKKVDEKIVQWASTINTLSDEPIRVNSPLLRISACTGVTYVMIEKMANEPGTVDESEAMRIAMESVYALFHMEPKNLDEGIARLKDSFDRERLTILGIEIL